MSKPDRPTRLYLVTPEKFEPEGFVVLLDRALAAQPVASVRLDLGAAPEDEWRVAAKRIPFG